MSRFPHLTKANSWPGLATVDPFDLQVTFDPYLWTPDVTIHLARTALDSGYQNVGGWESASARDAWFDSVSDRTLQVDSEMHILPGVEIKLPFAFEVLQGYDHLYIDFPPTPTDGGSESRHRYYYFLEDVQYRSPSSTACIITLDEWTTHMFDVDIRYINLDRGHAPMAAVSADAYLANPRDNCEFLTTPDEDGGGSGERLSYTAREIINAGPHWLVFAMTADAEQDPGTYGHRENWRVPTTSAHHLQGALSSPSTFAIEPADANTMINRINEQAPQLMPTLQAVFLIPKRYVTVGNTFSFLGVQAREITPTQTISNIITLNKAMFKYPSRYANIAKLYTSPYAWLETTDERGGTQRIMIEDTTGQLKLSVLASILVPYIGIDAYVGGIGNGDETTLSWQNMDSHSFEVYGDWTSSLRHWNIPTYAVLQNSERSFEWTNYWQRQQAAETNQAGYDLAIQNNNLNYSLRGGNLDRQAARLTQQQANDSAQLALGQTADNDILNIMINKTNADIVIDKDTNTHMSELQQQEFALAASNANSSASYTNAENKIALGLAHDYQDYVAIDGSLGVATASINTVGNLASNIASMNNLDAMLLGKTDEQAIGTLQQGLTDAVGIASSVNSMNYGNASANAAVSQAQLNLWGAKQNAKNIQATYNLAMSNNTAVASWTNMTIDVKTANAIQCETDKLARQQTLDSASLALQQSYQTAISNGDIAVARAQAGAIKGMSDTSITRRKQLQDESLANAHRAGRLGSPHVFSQPAGSVANYTRPQTLMVNIKTQDKGSIAVVGDAFLQYGYRMGGRQWTIQTWTPMSKFTYWKGRIRIGAAKTNAVTREVIRGIFSQGTNIWRDPRDIGVTSIYDNGV